MIVFTPILDEVPARSFLKWTISLATVKPHGNQTFPSLCLVDKIRIP